MQVIKGGGEKSQNKLQRQRNGLLAKIHIAAKELGLDDKTYRDILRSQPWCVASAADLPVWKLEKLVNHFISMGWKESPKIGQKESQIEALRERIMEVAAQMENGAKRAQGLCKTICRTDRLEWCRDIGKLKRMLVIMEKIRAEEEGKSA
ncbi:MAG: phage protein GemA/Gp16 family protein [Pseudomonadota bacterium]